MNNAFKTITVRISDGEDSFLQSIVDEKEYMTKSEVVRDGIRVIRREKEKREKKKEVGN